MSASKTEQMVTRRRGEKKQNFLAIEALKARVLTFLIFTEKVANQNPHSASWEPECPQYKSRTLLFQVAES